MSLMFGGAKSTIDVAAKSIKKTINYLATAAGELPAKLIKQEDGTYRVASADEVTAGEGLVDVTWYKADTAKAEEGVVTSADAAGDRFIGVYTVSVAAGNGKTITVDAAHFPGTYRVVGDTYSRSEASGEDELTWNSSLVA